LPKFPEGCVFTARCVHYDMLNDASTVVLSPEF